MSEQFANQGSPIAAGPGLVRVRGAVRPVARETFAAGDGVCPVNAPEHASMAIVAQEEGLAHSITADLPPLGAGGELFLPVGDPGIGDGRGPYMLRPTMAVRVGGAGTTVRVTTVIPHSLEIGEQIRLSKFAPATYNGEFHVSAVIDATHFQVVMKVDPGGPATTLGCATWADLDQPKSPTALGDHLN